MLNWNKVGVEYKGWVISIEVNIYKTANYEETFFQENLFGIKGNKTVLTLTKKTY